MISARVLDAARRPATWALAATGFFAAIFLFEYDADGPLSVHDGVWYGIWAERNPQQAIMGHHPLFHVLVVLITKALSGAGLHHAGHVAARTVAGLGAAAAILGIVRLSRSRWLVGWGFAACVLATRMFLVEAGVGETVLPACAAALFAIDLASSAGTRAIAVGAVTVVALWLRQDNVLAVPGIVLAHCLGLPKGRRLARAAAFVGICGAIAAAGYLLMWYAGSGAKVPLTEWLLQLSAKRDWNLADAGVFARIVRHVDAFGAAAVGRHCPWEETQPWLSAATLAPLAAAAWLLRARTRPVRLMWAAAVTVAVRAVFFIRFEAHNPEWHVMTWLLVAGVGAGWAAGEPAMGIMARRAGGVLLAAFCAGVLACHGPWTWKLRDRTLIGTVDEVVAEGRGRWRFVAYDYKVASGFALRAVKRDVVPGTLPEAMAAIAKLVRDKPVPTLVLFDRFVIDGEPYTIAHHGVPWPDVDQLTDGPGIRVFRRDGRSYAILLSPPGTETR